ncbi:polysaccharide biosynthesis C-terminal domain-containing protein [Paenarthrobacter sp. Z7-10]|uniref:lipopolysaccharide biosynthesis protein n=1 Tax=Paenarthrobacter sp. Z7-10 TaxID=2787635 RepID=UPI0022A913E2|nr:polysaccharide biosynthesis C-terminal domain-containing protein [Paenarthrobacter sp. Z7-10]MCZ2402945.1 polysaccharide biosynthesis C-terminal domain-containing protein [Paenarthrobacter sp. Z7-10]
MTELTAARSIDSQLSRIARSGSLNLLGAVIAAICNFGLIVVITKNFDQGTAGMLFSATSAFLILLGAATLGTEGGLARFMLRFEATGRAADIPLCVSVALRPVLLTSVGLALATVLLAGWIAPAIGLTTADSDQVLIAFAVLLPIAAWGDFALAGARAFGSVRSTVVLDKFLRPVLQPAAVWLAALIGGGIVVLSTAWAIPYAVAAVFSVWFFRRMLKRRQPAQPMATGSTRAVIRREFWSFTWPRGIARLCQTLLQRSDIILIAALLSVQDAAIYTAATRFVALGQFGANAIQQVLQPRFSQLLSQGKHQDAAEIFRISTSWSMAVAWPLYMVTGTASTYYLLIFGAGYTAGSAVAVVVIMSVAMLLAVASGPLDTMLLMAGGSRTSLWISLATLALDLGLCIVLIPFLGITGAGVAWAVSVAFKNALTLARVRALLSMSPFSKSSALVALANLLCFGLPLLTLTLLHQHHAFYFAAVFLAGCLVYAALLWLWRRPLRLQAFRSLLKRKTPTTAKGL